VTYYYQVTAVLEGEGEVERASATPASVLRRRSLLAFPRNSYVDLTWTALSNGGRSITNFTIYRGTTSGGEAF
jgi:hypothetical protein